MNTLSRLPLCSLCGFPLRIHLTGQFVSAEQSVGGHISASPGIWPMADCYIVLWYSHSCVRSHPHRGVTRGGAITEGILNFGRGGFATCSRQAYGEGGYGGDDDERDV